MQIPTNITEWCKNKATKKIIDVDLCEAFLNVIQSKRKYYDHK